MKLEVFYKSQVLVDNKPINFVNLFVDFIYGHFVVISIIVIAAISLSIYTLFT